MSSVGIRYPREMAKLRGVNRRGLVTIIRGFSDSREPSLVTEMPGFPLDEIREARARSKQNGMWHDHWTKGIPNE